jgi:hypothetical protein
VAKRASLFVSAVGAILSALGCAPAAAQSAPPLPAVAGDPEPSYLTPAPLRANNPLLQKTQEYQGIALSGWMFYPEFLAETIYNSNVALSSVQPRAEIGVNLHPDFYALRDAGLSKTEVYAAADAYLYPGAPRDTQLDGTLGVAETYTPTPDLTLKGQLQLDRLGGFADGGSVIGPGGTPTELIAPSQSNRIEGSAGAQKSFGRLFLGASVFSAATSYDPLATAIGSLSQTYRNSVVTTLTERAGYWISPLLYGYAETAENWRQYAGDALGSHGYRAVVGLGSDRLSLFRGEVFAGYQMQIYDPPLPGSAQTPVLGAKLYWYPTRALTLSAALDETFTDSSNPAPGNPRGDPARDISAALDANYQLHRQWSATAEGRVDRAYYIGAPRVDTTYSGSARLNYQLMRNVDLTLSNTFAKVDSNAVNGSYVDDIASLGARYRF